MTGLAANYPDPKAFWRKVNLLSGKTTRQDAYLTDANGARHYSARDKERLFTPIWERVFDGEDDPNDLDDNEAVLNYMNVNLHRTRAFDRADPARLTGNAPLNCLISSWELAGSIKGKSTCPGVSKINKTILSHLPDSALARLRAIFNAALSAGYFPHAFKEAEMRMIPKAGKDTTRAENYRPISLLEVPGKLLEKIITVRLRDHLEQENLLNPAQYGFRRGRGTVHAIAVATEMIAIHQASGSRCNLVLRDVSKAFDKVWHLGLQYQMLHLGLPGPVERFLCGFLEGRTAKVRVGGHRGPSFPLTSGVPQGSVLSPILYSIYTTNYPASHAGANILYADDVSQVVFFPGRSSRMLNERTGREILRINDFEENWKIQTNLAKFTVLPLATYNPAPLLVDGDVVDFRPRGSLLGLAISTRGYTSHVTQRVVRARAALVKLYRFRELDTRLKLHLVKSLVLPILTYPPIPTHAFSRTAISRLQKVQNSALRFVYNTRWDDFTTSASLHDAASLPALNVRLHQLATQVWSRMEAEDWDQYHDLLELHEGAPDRDHAWFPRSILRLERDPAPLPRYR